jgi:hypothetical protein
MLMLESVVIYISLVIFNFCTRCCRNLGDQNAENSFSYEAPVHKKGFIV